jgi:PAS domain S-box-containing protein
VSLQRLRDARFWHVLATVMVAIIFVLDTQAPRGIAVPVFYVLPTILFVSGSGFAEPLIVAAVATVLTAAGYYASSPVGDDTSAMANRVIATAVIWSTAALVVGYVRSVERWTRQLSTANEALEASMRRLKDIEHALDQSAIVAATDQTGRITYANDKFCEISQYSREELLGQDHRIINSGHHPKEFIRELWRTIAQGRIWRGELRNRAKDGSIYWVDTTIVPFLNERGKPWQYLSIRSDVTQRKAAEQKLREEAALTQLGQLSAVVAHEVRNPLAAVKGSLQVLATRGGAGTGHHSRTHWPGRRAQQHGHRYADLRSAESAEDAPGACAIATQRCGRHGTERRAFGAHSRERSAGDGYRRSGNDACGAAESRPECGAGKSAARSRWRGDGHRR